MKGGVPTSMWARKKYNFILLHITQPLPPLPHPPLSPPSLSPPLSLPLSSPLIIHSKHTSRVSQKGVDHIPVSIESGEDERGGSIIIPHINVQVRSSLLAYDLQGIHSTIIFSFSYIIQGLL